MGRRDQYLTQTVQGHRRTARLVAQGWEVVSTSSRFLSVPAVTLRKPNPKYKP
jgi:hypothetical protein